MKFEVIFESERINFVKISEELVNDYLAMVNDEEVQKYISRERKTYTLEGEIEWVKEKIKSNDIIFSMIEKESNDFIGNIEITNIIDDRGEIGIAISSKKQNMHYGQESMKRVIEYAFNELNLNELELNVYSFNTRAIKCYEKVGFIKDGIGKTKEDINMSLKKKI